MAIEETDPSRLKWALNDLEDFTFVAWSGGDAIISSDIIGRTRDAAKFVIAAYEASGLTKEEVSDLADKLTDLSETLHSLGSNLKEIEIIGATDGVIEDVLQGIVEARGVVESLIPQVE